MLNDNINAVITSSNSGLFKEITEVNSEDKPLSAKLKLIQTEVNEFLTDLINEAGEEEIEDYESADEESEDDSMKIQKETQITAVKRTEQNIKSNKKIKKT